MLKAETGFRPGGTPSPKTAAWPIGLNPAEVQMQRFVPWSPRGRIIKQLAAFRLHRCGVSLDDALSELSDPGR